MAKSAPHVVNTKGAQQASPQLLEAIALHQSGRLDDAEGAYKAILASRPRDGDALHYLGLIAFQRKQYEESIQLISQAIAANPTTPGYYCNLGNALICRTSYADAEAAFLRAAELDPGFSVAFVGLARAQLALHHTHPALASALRATKLAPDLHEAWVVLGDAQYAEGQIDEAESSYRRALAIRPEALAVVVKHANLLATQGEIREANVNIERVLAQDPDNEPAWWSRLMHLCYLSDAALEIQEMHREWAQRFAPNDTDMPMRALNHSAKRRIRVGYLSADFRQHAMRFFVRPILRHHDRSRFEIHCYSVANQHDEVSKELMALTEHWHECTGLGDNELAERIVADEIDILVDLIGHSHGSRLHALASKPAPVQLSMLGYLGPTGLKAMDYRVGDAYTLPQSLDEFPGERLVRFPDCQWCYEPDAEMVPVAALPARHSGAVCFGLFHNLAKLTPEQLGLIEKIITMVPGSRLLIVAWGAHGRESLTRRFRAAGLASRVEIVGAQSYQDYLALYNRVDLSLDAYPYSGGTTSFESLWMGVPVVTRRGSTQASNGTRSILANLGLVEFVGEDGEDFVQKAVQAASNLPRLETLRAELRQRLQASALMDGPRYVAALEANYLQFIS